MEQNKIWEIYSGTGPIIATAIHDGHRLRKEVSELMALTDSERLREEDPYTGKWTSIVDTQIIGLQSRFEVDLNRPREKAVYQKPEDAWGLNVWKNKPSEELISRSLDEYDAFYEQVYKIFREKEKQFGHFVVFDLHSYNHLRDASSMLPADVATNPEVNIGTGTMDRSKWAHIVDRFISDLSVYKYNSRKLDVRENIKFKGGQFSKWIHQTFPHSACSLSIEFKKFFMNEWTGEPNHQKIKQIRMALQSTIPGVLIELKKIEGK